MSHGDRMQDHKDDGDRPGQALYRNKHLPCNRQSESNTEKPSWGEKTHTTMVGKIRTKT